LPVACCLLPVAESWQFCQAKLPVEWGFFRCFGGFTGHWGNYAKKAENMSIGSLRTGFGRYLRKTTCLFGVILLYFYNGKQKLETGSENRRKPVNRLG
jgi:hypothetical protein